MKEFVKSLLTNRFGIVLGTLNVCYFLSQIVNNYSVLETLQAKTFICTNFPAAIAALLTTKVITAFAASHSQVSFLQIANLLMSVFIMAQWLFIAHLSRVIAQRIKPNLN